MTSGAAHSTGSVLPAQGLRAALDPPHWGGGGLRRQHLRRPLRRRVRRLVRRRHRRRRVHRPPRRAGRRSWAAARCSSWGSARVGWPCRWPSAGVEVHGIDASPAMLERLRAKPGAGRDPGDARRHGRPRPRRPSPVRGRVRRLQHVLQPGGPSTRSRRCLGRVAALLAPTGLFVLEAFVPSEDDAAAGRRRRAAAHHRRRGGAHGQPARSDGPDDHRASTSTSPTPGSGCGRGTSATPDPAQLDAMAEAAGLELAWRHAGWDGDPVRARLGRPRLRLPPR